MIKNKIIKEILTDYEKLQDQAKKILRQKLDFVYEKCPKIKQIDEQLNLVGISISKAIIKEDSSKRKELIFKIKKETSELKKEKQQLMLENGFKADFFDNVYKCKLCKDTGYVKNQKCICFKQKIISKVYDMSRLFEVTRTENFDNFNINFYSQKIDEKNKMAPLENIKMVLKKCMMFVENFDVSFKNLFIYGGAGLGKTFLCNCIAKDLLDKGKLVVYTSAFNLFNIIEKEKFSKNNDDIKSDFLDFIFEADLLIIDDLGTEFITSLSLTELFNFINTRILEKKSTIISTNLEPAELMQQYSSRIVSRIYGNYDMLKLFGDDIRMIKKMKK